MLQNKNLRDCIFEQTPNERILATSLLGRRKQLLRGLVEFESGMTLSSSVFWPLLPGSLRSARGDRGWFCRTKGELRVSHHSIAVVIYWLSHVRLFCSPMDCSPPGSSAHRILQARTLECVAMPSFRGSPQSRDQTHVSCIDRWILYHWTTWEGPSLHRGLQISFSSEFTH